MSDDGFWTRGKLIGSSVAAMVAGAAALLGPCRGALDVMDAPERLTAHEVEAAERDSIAAARLEEFERRLAQSRLVICELLGFFPSECPQFTIEHEGGP